ncbi:hypothetical protein K443DRAFT_93840 [Laccaria amethystina LaAM-08-1]|uniref:Uncharacterized protein n=1 Tax=Laccaria amethystina LaAM-08-1 TaxID=1095629 RepID=A0A0C9Y216_9AGAR|nr:hypothetical protein K443DRAFT_93840 [Laccaria amethystina LaAM-08-1]
MITSGSHWWRFINCSWCWMSPYRMGLTGKAAQWAVWKQKGHHSVSRAAMMHLDAVLNKISLLKQ